MVAIPVKASSRDIGVEAIVKLVVGSVPVAVGLARLLSTGFIVLINAILSCLVAHQICTCTAGSTLAAFGFGRTTPSTLHRVILVLQNTQLGLGLGVAILGGTPEQITNQRVFSFLLILFGLALSEALQALLDALLVHGATAFRG